MIVLDRNNPQPELRRTTLEFIALCAWNNIDPKKAPFTVEWEYFANSYMRDTWRRVCNALKDGHL